MKKILTLAAIAAVFSAAPAFAADGIVPDYIRGAAGIVLDKSPDIGNLDIKNNPAAFGAAIGWQLSSRVAVEIEGIYYNPERSVSSVISYVEDVIDDIKPEAACAVEPEPEPEQIAKQKTVYSKESQDVYLGFANLRAKIVGPVYATAGVGVGFGSGEAEFAWNAGAGLNIGILDVSARYVETGVAGAHWLPMAGVKIGL